MGTKVFISWSGDLSKRLAEALRRWLPCVLQNVEPYFTPEDIEKGTRWSSDITGELESSDIGVICLTKSNTTQPWILFEAGALSKRFEKSKVCTVLFDLEPTDVTGPLTIFQATRFEKADFKKLVKSINAAVKENKLDDAVLDDVFEKWWPDLEQKVQTILGDQTDDTPTDARSERDMLEELLELTRLQTRGGGGPRSPRQVELQRMEAFQLLLRLILNSLRATADSAPRPAYSHSFISRACQRIGAASWEPMKEVDEILFLIDSIYERLVESPGLDPSLFRAKQPQESDTDSASTHTD